jgi:8-oxo-dGTP pyrophosphatase MutT (NUDIX family)
LRRPEDAFVFVRRGSEFLVLHRSPEQGGYWHGVAGALEHGEAAADGAARELFEETGLVAVPTAVGEPYAYPLADQEPQRSSLYPAGTREVVVTSWVADAPAGWEPALDWEHDGYRWCSAAEACDLFHWPEPSAQLRLLTGDAV